MVEKLLYRLNEAADALGISRTVLYELINSGEIPVIRVRSDLRVPVAGLRAWLDKHPRETRLVRPRKTKSGKMR
jgi:excisionase family DNA binding protein